MYKSLYSAIKRSQNKLSSYKMFSCTFDIDEILLGPRKMLVPYTVNLVIFAVDKFLANLQVN